MLLAIGVAVALQACAPDSVLTVAAFDRARQFSGGGWLPDSTVTWRTPRTGAGPRLLADVEWDGPNQGALIVADCHGHILSARLVGPIDSLQLVHFTANGPDELLAYYVSGTGTGWLQTSVAALMFDADTLASVLDVVTEEHSSSNLANGSSEDSTTAAWSDPGHLLRTGMRFRLKCSGDDCSRTRGIRIRDTYVWSVARSRFVRMRRSG